MTGTELIAKERQRQIDQEGWTPEHDDEHDGGELAIAAACYAMPMRVYAEDRYANSVEFTDPWPWEAHLDKRPQRPHGSNVIAPDRATTKQRLNLLVKAGALIAAEIDRLQRKADQERER